jgi:hypothetical protein
MELYHVAREERSHALAAQHAPLLRFDTREPFLPLAAGYTVFEKDGPSPSMERDIRLQLDGKPPAALAIEYAIWWDWDIHHLYELEHVWVYLDEREQPIRVEASWHGEYNEIPPQIDQGRVVVLSEPGKHAFAPSPEQFRERAREYRRQETLAVGVHASVLINSMFDGKIRRRVFDRTLVRSYLTKQAFEPAWDFSLQFAFKNDWLVPWSALADWIPQRVNTWLERLETHTRPSDYRALRLMACEGTRLGLEAAARTGAEAVVLPVHLQFEHLRMGPLPDAITIGEAFQFLSTEPMSAFLQPANDAAVEGLAAFIIAQRMESYAVVISDKRELLSHYRRLIPNGLIALQFPSADIGPMLHAAQEISAQFICPRWENGTKEQRQTLDKEWVETVHRSGIAIISWPTGSAEERDALQRQGVDIVWQAA